MLAIVYNILFPFYQTLNIGDLSNILSDFRIGNISVYSGITSKGASTSPGDDAHQSVAHSQRTTGITLARVTVSSSSADHPRSDGTSSVTALARTPRYHGDIYGFQRSSGGTTGILGAPTTDPYDGSCTRFAGS